MLSAWTSLKAEGRIYYSNLFQVWVKRKGVKDKSRFLAYATEWMVRGDLFGHGKIQIWSRKMFQVCVSTKKCKNKWKKELQELNGQDNWALFCDILMHPD